MSRPLTTNQILSVLDDRELLNQGRKMEALKDSGGPVHPLLAALKTELARREIEVPTYLQPE